MKNYYITTPIYYPSAKLHLGHAYTTIAADVLKKYKTQEGYNVFYLTGTDEHGEKIEKKAKESHKDPQQFVDEIVKDIKSLWEMLNIDYDKFIRTTDQNHKKQVQGIFQKLLENDDIYLGEYEGKYCTSCESYFTDTQLIDEKCPDCGGNVNILKEESYFFRCSKYVDRLLEYFSENDEFILPKSRKNELINSFIKPGLQDLAISRTNFNWGIPIPDNEGHVLYVWIDALSNYITALNYGENNKNFQDFWPADVQLVGKEIIRFHVIYWPMILMALDLPLPKKIFAHGWLLMDSDKMSKSKGNIIYPEFLIKNYGVDSLRYYLMREVPFGMDGQFTPDTFVSRFNNDLVNDLGNLLNRTVAMGQKYFDGQVENVNISHPLSDELYQEIEKTFSIYQEKLENLEFSKSIEVVWSLISKSNKFIDLTEPWVLAKDPNKEEELKKVIHTLLEAIRNIAILINPFINETTTKIFKAINIEYDVLFTKLGNSKITYNLENKAEIIFPRLETEVEINKIKDNMLEEKEKAQKKLVQNVSFEEFSKVKMCVGEIVSCESHPNADRLLVSKINLGNEIIQVVSGIAQVYKPENIVGKKVSVVTNLEPTKIRGVASEGMILCSGEKEEIKILEVTSTVQIGDVIK